MRLTTFATLMFAACAGAACTTSTRGRARADAGAPVRERQELARNGERLAGAGATSQPIPIAQRQLVRRGSMTVEVREPAAAAPRIEAIARGMGGYVEASRTTDGTGTLVGAGATVTIRVPADSLDAAMDRVGTLGDVEARSTGTTDVTEAMVDMDARRATLVATRDRLRALLDRAVAVSDVVTVERELTRVQAELDSLDRRLTALRAEVALSELTVRLDQERVLGPLGLLLAGVGTVVGKLFIWR